MKIQHLAIIMDGNARWALQNNLLITEGHKIGAKNIKQLIPDILKLNIPYLTLYAFSSENWKRSVQERSSLLNLLNFYLNNESEIQLLMNYNIKIKIIGNFERLNTSTKLTIKKIMKLTEQNSKMTLCIAFSYGGRSEIIDAYNKIIQSKITKLEEKDFQNYLYDPNMPSVDLLIRTGNVLRISNFLLWQLAYTELFFSKKLWPAFTKKDLITAITNYYKRTRNFGMR